MAVVRITDTLRSKITNAIVRMFNKRVDALVLKLRALPVFDEAYTALYPPGLRAQLEALPPGWLTYRAGGCFSLNGYIWESSGRPQPAPAQNMRSIPEIDARWPSYEAVLNLRQQMQQTINERDELVGALTRLLESCSTLKQLLEAWPTAIDYIDAETLERHNAPDEPRAKRRKVVGVDDTIKAALLKARMLNNTQ